MIRKAEINDVDIIANLAVLMWSSHSVKELIEEFLEIARQEEAQFFLKYEGDTPIGFAQCQIRHDYVEGTDTCPVGYLEGIFIKEEHRHRGYAGELLSECERWAKEKGCREFASDCEIDNENSIRFHKSMNFMEVNRIVCFAKKL